MSLSSTFDDELAHLVAADLLDLRVPVEEAGVDVALAELGEQDVGDLLELEVAVAEERDLLVLQLDARRAALEVEARADFPGGLVDGVLDLDEVGF